MNYLLIALSLADKLMDKIPDYDQKKKQEFYEKKKMLVAEWNKPEPSRDNDLILNLGDELSIFLKVFHKELM